METAGEINSHLRLNLFDLQKDNSANSEKQPNQLQLSNSIPEKQDSAQPGRYYIADADNGKQGGSRLTGCQQKHNKIGKTV